MNSPQSTESRGEHSPPPGSAVPPSVREAQGWCLDEALGHSGRVPGLAAILRGPVGPQLAPVVVFVMRARSIVWGPGDRVERVREIGALESALEDCHHGRPQVDPLWVALAETVRDRCIPVDDLRAPLQGCRLDVVNRQAQTFAELERHGGFVAEPIGRLMLRFGEASDSELVAHADALSMALWLSDVVDDVASDAAMGRLLIPAEDLLHFGLRSQDLVDAAPSTALTHMLQFQASRAHCLLSRARPILHRASPTLAPITAALWHGCAQRLARQMTATDPRGDSVGAGRNQ